jgi:hypothetical protein
MSRQAVPGGIIGLIGNHSFCAAGITAYLSNGGVLERLESDHSDGLRRADTKCQILSTTPVPLPSIPASFQAALVAASAY